MPAKRNTDPDSTDWPVHRVAAQAALRPQAPAVRDWRGRELTYRQLWSESGRIADALARVGVGPGDPVVLQLDRSPELAAAMVAVARLGAWYVLPDAHAPSARHDALLQDVKPTAVVGAADGAPWDSAHQGPRLTLPLVPGSDTDPGTDGEPDDSPDGTAGLLHAPDGADTLYVAYTSGSTGTPKGVVASQRAVRTFLDTTGLCRFRPGDRVAWQTNPASDAATFEVWGPLENGATIVVLPLVAEVGVERWTHLLRQERVATMFLMAPLMELVAREDPRAFSSLDTLVFGGDAASIDLVRGLCGGAGPSRLVLGYGPTEATVFATAFECTADSLAGHDRVPLGQPLEGYHLAVLDEELRAVADGETGELCIGGPALADGYLGREALTRERFVEVAGRRLYRTGDHVRRLPDGALVFVGRVDRQVKIRGYRIELEEVERALLATGEARAAVVEKVGEAGQARLACWCVPADPAADAVGFRRRASAALARRLPGYMLPTRWTVLPELPMNSNGKLDRRALRGEVPQR